MDFDSYTDCSVVMAAGLANSVCSRHGELLADETALGEFLQRHQLSNPGRLDEATLDQVRALRPRIRAIFEAADVAEAARLINELIVDSAALPQLTAHDGEPWHLHFTPPGVPLAQRLGAEAAMGLAGVIRNDGFDRMRTCADDTCSDVFVDASRNRSRRFCDPDTCGNRANVAAYRARRRVAAQEAAQEAAHAAG